MMLNPLLHRALRKNAQGPASSNVSARGWKVASDRSVKEIPSLELTIQQPSNDHS